MATLRGARNGSIASIVTVVEQHIRQRSCSFPWLQIVLHAAKADLIDLMGVTPAGAAAGREAASPDSITLTKR